MKFATVAALAASTILGAGWSALAQEKTLYVAGPGGSLEQILRNDVFPAFEKQANVSPVKPCAARELARTAEDAARPPCSDFADVPPMTPSIQRRLLYLRTLVGRSLCWS
jgi:hypothetical protein